MKNLSYGALGSEVQLLQLALDRAGYGPLERDGVFGQRTRSALAAFQLDHGLAGDGVFGRLTRAAMQPWLTGSLVYTVRRGDSPYAVALRYGVGLRALETANPDMDPTALRPGQKLTVPLPFNVVPWDIEPSSALLDCCARGLAARYPFLTAFNYGRSVMGSPLWALALGEGRRTLLYAAAHHANEWITSLAALRFAEELAEAYAAGRAIRGVRASEIMEDARIYIAPGVNPDGVDLVTGALSGGDYFAQAMEIASHFPQLPFPRGWKANILGTDLNLQYPALWERAREIKYAQGFDRPAPRDYVGSAPLCAPESRALYELTRSLAPELVLALHTQGEVIYWRYLDRDPQGARHYGECFAAASGYALEETPYASAFAGFKDWFIDEYDRPGYTIESGLGENPLPIEDFPELYRRTLGIMVLAAAGC